MPRNPDDVIIAFAGDTSLQDQHHLSERRRSLYREVLESDAGYFFEGLRPLLDGADHTILNFESVLAEAPSGPLTGQKKYLGWDTPHRTLAALESLGTSAVSLANNHTMDFGEQVLFDTIDAFRSRAIGVFGAGRDRSEASAPFVIRESVAGLRLNVHVIGCLGGSTLLASFGFYAGRERAGVHRLRVDEIIARIGEIKRDDPEAKVVVFPHWGLNYVWPSDTLRSHAARLIDGGADFVIGHGAHMMQDFYQGENGAVVFSLGNFMFNHPGRFAKMEHAIPYSLVARLRFFARGGTLAHELKLYPVHCDNKVVAHQPRRVTQAEMFGICSRLNTSAAAVNPALTNAFVAKDAHGWHFAFTPTPAADDVITFANAVELHRLGSRVSKGLATYLLSVAAAEQGFRLRCQGKSTLLYPQGATTPSLVIEKAAVFFWKETRRKMTDTVNGRAVAICQDKQLTKQHLERAGLSVARGRAFGERAYDDAVRFARSLTAVVVKPLMGGFAKGVSIGVMPEDFEAAFRSALAVSRGDVLVEQQFVGGTEARYLVAEDAVIGVVMRRGPRVVGDGRSTIAELIVQKNVMRQQFPNLASKPLKMNPHRLRRLANAGLSLDSVLPAGQELVLADESNTSAGGESFAITTEVHPTFKAIAVQAVAAVPDLLYAGVDIIARDHTSEARADDYIVLEVNSSPGMGLLQFPVHGEPVHAARRVMDAVVRKTGGP